MVSIETQINDIVQRVLTQLEQAPPSSNGGSPRYRGIFSTIDSAMAAVELAQRRYYRVSIAQRKAIIQAIRNVSIDQAQEMAQMVVAETGMGRVADKVLKHLLVAEKTPGPEFLNPDAYVGDDGLMIEECAPFGTILSITPVTNPTATIINNTISMLSAGNTVFFAPHPNAIKSSIAMIDLINDAIVTAGGPDNLVVSLDTASIELVDQLMKHPKIALLRVTGGTGVVDVALQSGKRAIGAAAGNPPVLVDDTADPEKAARDIVAGHSFDNNMPCTSEKEVVVTEGIADRLLEAFTHANALVLDPKLLSSLEAVVLNDRRSGPNRKFIGQNACVILKEIGIQADEELRTIVVEVDKDHPFARHELMMPVLAVIRVPDFEAAIDLAVELEEGLHHSAIIHSANIYHMSEFGKAINTTLFVKNAPSYAGLGFGGEGYTSFTIAGRTGEGMTTCRTFTRFRRCSLVGAFSSV
ncbi:MAG TPA: aldehyde dehydrogenase EutE [Anaerolineae bacterium]|nr:aldehyde dehydrogenase EutE [Anaerolineae bacterium]